MHVREIGSKKYSLFVSLELAAENERIAQEKIQMKSEVDKLNESVSRIKVQDHNMMDHFNHRFILENKIRDTESEMKALREEKQRYEVDFKILQERHNELKKNSENNENELNFLRHKQTEVRY